MSEAQRIALETLLSAKAVNPSDAGLSPVTIAALRRRGWAERTGHQNHYRITRAGAEALAEHAI